MPVSNNAWRLYYPPGTDKNGATHLGADLTFGRFQDNVNGRRIYLLSEPDTSLGEHTTNDVFLSFEDSRRFGIDYSGSTLISFDLAVDTVSATDPSLVGRGLLNADSLGVLRSAWRADAVRTRSGAVAELHRGLAGRTRMVYGRPRRFSVAGAAHATKGYTTVVCDFQCADDLFYDEIGSSAQVGIITSTEIGLTQPLTEPMTTASSGNQAGTFTVGGNAPTWITVTFNGPISYPSVEIFGKWKTGLRGSLVANRYAVIDPRPWARTAVTEYGAYIGNAFTQDSVSMTSMKLSPGTYTFRLYGNDVTASATCRLDWKNAWTYW